MAPKDDEINHPYYPRSLHLPHYVPNDKSVGELLGVFFGLVGVFVVLAWILTGRKEHLQARVLVRMKVCWFLACGLIHSILEGYFTVNSKTLAGEQTFLAQMWKEYGKGDSRYISDDTFMVCMEGITAFVDGPLAFWAFYDFLSNKPSRYVSQLLLSLCQLYGDSLYFLTAFKDNFKHGEMYHPVYFWFYFFFLNSLWIIIPFTCIVESVLHLTSAQKTADLKQKKKSS